MKFMFFFNDTATTEIYTLSLHDALPICPVRGRRGRDLRRRRHLLAGGPGGRATGRGGARAAGRRRLDPGGAAGRDQDRKSTRLNSSHANISYAVFCLKKNNTLLLTHHHS